MPDDRLGNYAPAKRTRRCGRKERNSTIEISLWWAATAVVSLTGYRRLLGCRGPTFFTVRRFVGRTAFLGLAARLGDARRCLVTAR
jgi:hypothetical protein